VSHFCAYACALPVFVACHVCLPGDARELVLQQQLQADADLAAVHDIQQLEEAAKRAAAAAIRHHERSRAVWTAQLQQQD
jgi:hypothetical protein